MKVVSDFVSNSIRFKRKNVSTEIKTLIITYENLLQTDTF